MTEYADLFEARWKGITDLDDEALAATSLDSIVFAVVAFRVEEMGATKINKDGRKRRKDIFHVEDARVLLGEMREQAVQFLAGKETIDLDTDPVVIVGNNISRLPVRDPEGMAANIRHLKEAVDEVDYSPIPEPEVMDEEEPVVMRVDDYKKTAKPEPSGRDGVKVARFVEDDAVSPVSSPVRGDVQHLGSVRSPGYQGKDKYLRKFMES